MALCHRRRLFFKQLSGLLAAVCLPVPYAHALWPEKHYAASPLDVTLKQLFEDKVILPSDQIDINVPLIAENGAVVPVTVSATIPAVQKIYLLVDKNPVPLVAEFALSEKMQAVVSARVKMAQTGDVWVIAETAMALYSASTNVKVTIGGCGG